MKTITAKIEGQTYQIPQMWVIGFMRGMGGSIEDAVRDWHSQAQIEATRANRLHA